MGKTSEYQIKQYVSKSVNIVKLQSIQAKNVGTLIYLVHYTSWNYSLYLYCTGHRNVKIPLTQVLG